MSEAMKSLGMFERCRQCTAELAPGKAACPACGTPVPSSKTTPSPGQRSSNGQRLRRVVILLLTLAVLHYLRPYVAPYLRLMWPPWLAPLTGEAMIRLEENSEAAALLGQPLRHGLLVGGFSKNYPTDWGAAELRIPVTGSKSSGILRARLRRVSGPWVFSELNLALADGKYVNLLDSAGSPPRVKLNISRRVYLVPLGRAGDLGLDELPDFYRKEFGLHVEVLASIPLDKQVRDPVRRQLIAEELIGMMQRRLHQFADDKSVVLIGVTDEDMYYRGQDWPFAYTFWEGNRAGLVSSARFRPSPSAVASALLKSRVRKMISRVMGVVVYELPFSEDPTSVMAKDLYGAFSADLMSEKFDGLGALAVVDDFKSSQWFPTLPAEIMPEMVDLDEQRVDGRYPCLLIRKQRGEGGGANTLESISRCLPRPVIDAEVDEFEIDLRTGQLTTKETDLFVPGRIPLAATRCYRLWDESSRAFGYNTALSWDMFPVGSRKPYTYIDLIFCNGSRIHFDRISKGTGYLNALYEHRQTVTPFLRSRFKWNGGGWDLTQKDAAHMVFPESANAKRDVDAALIGFSTGRGDAVEILRDRRRNLRRLNSPNGGYIVFDHDSGDRVVKTYDNRHQSISYVYDIAGRLVEAQGLNRTRRYTYDGTYLMTIHENGHVLVDFRYTRGRIGRVQLPGGRDYKLSYTFDPRDDSTVIQTYLTGPDGAVSRFDVKPQ